VAEGIVVSPHRPEGVGDSENLIEMEWLERIRGIFVLPESNMGKLTVAGIASAAVVLIAAIIVYVKLKRRAMPPPSGSNQPPAPPAPAPTPPRPIEAVVVLSADRW